MLLFAIYCDSLSLVVIHSHLLYHSLSLVVSRCHSLCRSLLFIVIGCHSLPLDVPLVCLFMNDRHRTCSVKKRCQHHRKTPMLKSVFNKIAGVQPYNFIKRRLQHRCFSCQNSGIFKSIYFKEHLKNKEHLPTAASCVSEAKYAYVINCHTRWNQLYISTIVSEKCSCFVLCLKFSSLFYEIFV